MKANELMIGDWVQVPSTARKYEKMETTCDIDCAVCYSPVPLTDEILKKNRFEYFHKNLCSLNYDHPFKLEMKQ